MSFSGHEQPEYRVVLDPKIAQISSRACATKDPHTREMQQAGSKRRVGGPHEKEGDLKSIPGANTISHDNQ
jgi:hypothetical protein